MTTDNLSKMGSDLARYSGPHYSFLGLPAEKRALDTARAVIVPTPYDGTTTYRSGTRAGPRAILDASRELEWFDEETLTEAYLEGVATLDELAVNVASPRQMIDTVRKVGESLLGASKLPVLLGGEHLLSLGMIEAVAHYFPDVTILHLDAHADLREEYQGSIYSNACIMRQALRHAPLVQVGIRSLTREEYDFIRSESIPCFFAQDLAKDSSLWEQVVSSLGANVYISIDLDVFDPAIMPAVGTPEPGGLGWREVLSLLRRVVQKCRIVGFDVMELLPLPPSVASDFLAARLVYKLLTYIFLDNPPLSC